MPSRYLVFRQAETMASLSGSESDLQRRVSLVGKQNSDKSFAMIFTRRRRGDLETQQWRHHSDEEVEFVIQGRMQIQIGSKGGGVIDDFEVSAGDVLYIPAGTKHRADSIGDELCIGIVFCPEPYDVTVGQQSVLS